MCRHVPKRCSCATTAVRRDRAGARPVGPGRPARRRAGGAADAGVRAAARAADGLRDRPGHLRVPAAGAARRAARRRRGASGPAAAYSCSRDRSRPRRGRGGARAGAASPSAPTRTRRGLRSSPRRPGPRAGARTTSWPAHRPMFAPDAIEIRFVAGAFTAAGRRPPGFACATRSSPARSPRRCSGWPRPATSATGSARRCRGTSTVHQPRPDAVHRARAGRRVDLPGGADARSPPSGIGTAESVLYDERGRVGRATQALARRAAAERSATGARVRPTSAGTP